MNKIRSFVNRSCQVVAAVGTFISLWKLARCWRTGCAERTGHIIDASISAAAKKLEKTLNDIELQADNGLGESLGKGLDDVLTDTKKKLDKATSVVNRALHHAK